VSGGGRPFVRGVLAGALAVAAVSCARQKAGAGRRLPAGDAIYLSAGLGADPSDPERILERGAFGHVLLPAVDLSEGGGWKAEERAAPARPVARMPVVLVVAAGPGFDAALAETGADALAARIGDALSRALSHRTAFGAVEGVALDLPFSEPRTEAFGALATRVRSRLPADLFLLAALRDSPNEKARPDFLRHLSAADGFLAAVFGQTAGADPVAIDALGKPWWALYAPSARGEWTDASGARHVLFEGALAALTDDARASLSHDLELSESGTSGFVFHVSAPFEVPGGRLAAGDTASFHQPALSELMYRLGSDLSGKKFVRGRIVKLDGAAESDRLLTLEAVSDVLQGRPLLPDLRVSVAREGASLRISAANVTPHASLVSRTANWVEVDVPSGHIRDVTLGGFDRYEVFDADGRPVTPGRATRVQLFETLVGPREKLEDAAIIVAGRLPGDCCRFRQHLLAASGQELTGDWVAPPPEPTPIPPRGKPKAKGALRKR
jgi:hypothetical protein